MYVAAAAVGTLRECGAHLGGAVSREQLYIPFFLDAASQQVEREVLLTQPLADADYAFY